MSDTSPVLSLPFIQAAQSQKHVTHNEALRVLDAVVQLVVVTADQDTPPGAPEIGARYIVAEPGSGAWAGQAGNIAVWQEGGWFFVPPQTGWRAEVLSPAGAVVFDAATGWSAPAQTTQQLGINATADTTNRLSISAPATLLNHEGAGHQLKVNKAAAGDTASLLYQTGFSGRAEMGLAGDDDFAIKVSADGSGWQTALRADAASGIVDFAQGATVAGQEVLSRGDLQGTVSQVGGAATGAVIERGSNASGDYVRFADGTQICTREVSGVDTDISAGAIFRGSPTSLDYPAAFASGTIVAGAGSSVNTGHIWVNGRATSTTSWAYTTFSYVARTGDTIALMAVGRWF
ncbi:DUF2793 domain-containing protein [Pseudosulfitobacter sp. DSM 107133]|uniref:DUF2793 domain-containing protein n=1 Tax=Pseudosulfitobacter sp. DSM 107133 TaxID=2883100 RepID=UPI0013B40639|nr:DUF2793 domain-containing protein [Pseudosulfitobacter sp. DSM 107133]UOA29033.1 hypothetical protein DSM107133_03792 [Pseudosulfitobacter sp. DSM 107133]